jgi:uncharacterized protein (DUF58 family)
VSLVRLRKRAGALTLGAAVVFLMGTNAQAGWLLVIAAILVGAVLAGAVLPLAGLRGLEAEVVAPDETTQGEATYVDVRLALRGRGVRWGLRVRDDHLASTQTFVDALRSGERAHLTTERVAARRGRHRAEHVEVRTSAPFGVAERRRKLSVAAETLVVPSVVPLGPLPFVDPVGTAEPAIHSAPRRGHGPDYLGIREYRTGDSMRHVHWASTARHGAVMVREFEEERTRRLLVVIDTERDAKPSGPEPTPLDRCCTAAASLATSALAHGHGSRLAARTSDGLEVLSRSDDLEILRWLAELEASGVGLAEAAADLPLDATRGAETVVIVAPAWAGAEGSLATAAGVLGGVVPRVAWVLVGTAAAGEPDPAMHAVGASLLAAGAEVHPWPVGADLAEAVGARP